MQSWLNDGTEDVQRRTLASLLKRGVATLWGHDHGLSESLSMEQFCESQPAVGYEDIRPWVARMIDGEANLLWPGVTRRFAQSSGTSGGKSKFIPVTGDSLRENHYRGGTYSVALYLAENPESRIFGGRNFILGGSYDNTLGISGRVRVGDLSASLIDCMNPLAALLRVPPKRIALMSDWEKKLPALVDAAVRADVRVIAGVPSWFLGVIKSMLNRMSAASVHDVWPNLEVFFHGGIAFGPYRSEYNAVTDRSKMHYVENYNASEGFFSVQDRLGQEGMLLLPDCGVFYEFLPVGHDIADGTLPMWRLEQDKVYEMIVTAPNGLWRYRIGDTVRVVSVDPVRIVVAGRTQAFINAFGEELMVCNADSAIEQAASLTGASVADYTAAPVYASGNRRGYHQWVVEFVTEPVDMELFVRELDRVLREENSDYDAKRTKDIFLAEPQVVVGSRGVFDRWLEQTGRRGGQRKVPRLSNNREVIDSILKLNE